MRTSSSGNSLNDNRCSREADRPRPGHIVMICTGKGGSRAERGHAKRRDSRSSAVMTNSSIGATSCSSSGRASRSAVCGTPIAASFS